MTNTRRKFCLGVGSGIIGAGIFGTYVMAGTSVPVIHISAKKFAFTPAVVTLQLGQPVILELVSQDVVMGFNAPDFGARTDLIPGKTQQLTSRQTNLGSLFMFAMCSADRGTKT